jgi:hypothetical protein
MSRKKRRKHLAEVAKRIRQMQERHRGKSGSKSKSDAEQRLESDRAHWRRVCAECYDNFEKAMKSLHAQGRPIALDEIRQTFDAFKKELRRRVKNEHVLREAFATANAALNQFELFAALPNKEKPNTRPARQ